jgi:hypothetical protein
MNPDRSRKSYCLVGVATATFLLTIEAASWLSGPAPTSNAGAQITQRVEKVREAYQKGQLATQIGNIRLAQFKNV